MSEDELANLWLPELGRRLDIAWQVEELTADELQAADELVSMRYAWKPWTERRVKPERAEK